MNKGLCKNSRNYDPRLGRFLSPDNFVQDPGSTQSFNRFAYCLNNPLKYTDPSGYKWRSWWDHWLPVIAIAAVAIVASVVTLGALAPVGAGAIFAASVVAGGVSGFISGMATAYINGGSLGDVLQAGVTRSIMGMMTAVATAGISALVRKIPVTAKFNRGRLVILHSFDS